MDRTIQTYRRAALRVCALIMALVVGITTGCAVFAPGDIESFELMAIGGRPVPVLFEKFVAAGGTVHGIQIVTSRLFLHSDQRFKREVSTRETIDGVPVGRTKVERISGTYRLDGTHLTLTWKPAEANPEIWTFDRLDDGGSLTGVEYYHLSGEVATFAPVSYRRER